MRSPLVVNKNKIFLTQKVLPDDCVESEEDSKNKPKLLPVGITAAKSKYIDDISLTAQTL